VDENHKDVNRNKRVHMKDFKWSLMSHSTHNTISESLFRQLTALDQTHRSKYPINNPKTDSSHKMQKKPKPKLVGSSSPVRTAQSSMVRLHTTAEDDTAQNSSDNLLSYPLNNCHRSDIIYSV